MSARSPPYALPQHSQSTTPFVNVNLMPPSLSRQPSYKSECLSPGSSSSHNHNPFTDFYSHSSHSDSYRGISSKYALHPNPEMWGYDVSPKSKEEDDWLHQPDKEIDSTGSIFTTRGLSTVGCLSLLAFGLVGLFLGFPLTTAILHKTMSRNGGYNLGGINATGQVMEGVFSLIDRDTPHSAYTKPSPVDGREMQLVFSDEFEVEGRSFYPGDDPFWEAIDAHYWGTKDLEWYDPQTITTKEGKLVIEFREEPNHDLQYMGGHLSSWNKFCFTGGLIEVSVQLPGSNDVSGYWPAVWTMGNLGRAGYGATTEGMWPYSYEACDVGTLANQTLNGVPDVQGQQLGDHAYNYSLSYLPGQRLSGCTCPGEDHPGPMNRDGTFRGRSAPEIDVLEAQIDANLAAAAVSQSCQFAPYNAYYSADNVTYYDLHQTSGTQEINGFKGNVFQQAASVVSRTNQRCYEKSSNPCYSVYGFQYKPGYQSDEAYITWINDNKLSWTLHAGAVGADPIAQISERLIPAEPMYIIMNLGMSHGFSNIDFANLQMPGHMSVDYVRVYQYPDDINYGCDPPNYPTSSYINRFIEAYTNPNITQWATSPEEGGYGQKVPKNRLIDTC
ncbi:related to KRE6-beta-1,6-glucan synthetase [Serendipita indica DSM 11827]|uniref:Related to KRE6-beta-1,6-glucan synthetase n=1 Tax=Serendipita indica (strain DSM 11827) TaxID=1109443 RepID=G4TF95_SERID|nr:related to KRE6-beta-1,6-glucan synthetase [Serendipita indica DSM 11827]